MRARHHGVPKEKRLHLGNEPIEGTRGVCACGAMRYASRKAARKAGRRVPDRKAQHPVVTSCRGYWHISPEPTP